MGGGGGGGLGKQILFMQLKPMFPDVGDRETFEQTLKITNISATMFLTYGQGFSLARYLNFFP